uniref:Uncharacterized protein n=1 Tax=Anopheles minimus TaxID=112268 RepID=A0A182VVB6_9DIPT
IKLNNAGLWNASSLGDLLLHSFEFGSAKGESLQVYKRSEIPFDIQPPAGFDATEIRLGQFIERHSAKKAANILGHDPARVRKTTAA